MASPVKHTPAPVQAKPAPQPTAKEVKAANVIESNEPLPAVVVNAAIETGDAAKFSRAFEIEDNIPLPQKRIGQKGESIYPFDRIDINQSFFVASSDAMKEPWKTLTSMASRMGRDMHPKKFVTARMKNKEGVEGVRVWRGADAVGELAPPRAKRSKTSGAALEQEAIDGDTSAIEHPEPMFDESAES